jgi:hypothetical protein
MDEAGQALQQELEGLNEAARAENPEAVAASEAIITAGTRLDEMKQPLEQPGGLDPAASDHVRTLAVEASGALTEAAEQLKAHVEALQAAQPEDEPEGDDDDGEPA